MTTPVEKLFDMVEMKPTGQTEADSKDGLPVLVMTGKLTIADLELECGVLSDGRRIFFGNAFNEFIAALTENTP